MANLEQQESNYDAVCENGASWDFALGGDSHGRNMLATMASILGGRRFDNGVGLANDFNFADGGRRAINFRGDALFNMLRNCNASIVLLHLGGNDLDMPNGRPWQSVVRDLLTLFVDLERAGKICFIVALPCRHSTRHQDLREMKTNIKAVNRKLKRVLERRFIPIPSALYDISAFEPSRFRRHGVEVTEYVHLKPWAYRTAALQVLDRLNRDLRGRTSPPRRFMDRVNNTIALFQ